MGMGSERVGKGVILVTILAKFLGKGKYKCFDFFYVHFYFILIRLFFNIFFPFFIYIASFQHLISINILIMDKRKKNLNDTHVLLVFLDHDFFKISYFFGELFKDEKEEVLVFIFK